MRKIFYLLLLLSTSFFYGQTSGISYQAVIYNPNGQNIPGVNIQNSPMVNRPVCLRFNLIDNLSQLEYQEVIQTTTDEFGMVNLIIGSGNQTGGYSSSFDSIVWNSNTKSLKVEFDTNGNCQQFVILSNNPFSTVPFAYAAVTATTVSGVVAIQNGGTGATNITDAKINLVLNNVDNTSDLNKPISTATQAALDTKENTIAAGTTSQYYRGDKTWQTLDKSAVGLSNVDNTSDLNKPISTATQAALDAKENSANKSTITTLGTSNTLYPTQNAVKTYVDTQIASATIPDATTLVKGKIQLAGDLSGTAASPTVPGLANKENNIVPGTTAQYYRGDKTWQTLDKTTVGLANVDNTSDANKPISTATQAALNTKENTANKSISVPLDGTSNIKFPSVKAVKDYVDGAIAVATIPDATSAIKGKIQLAGDLGGTAAAPTVPGLANKENTIAAGTTAQYYRGDKTWQTLDKSAVGLANVNNTSDLNKPISTATQTALDAKENLANKSTTTTLGSSNDLYPTQNAVKTYVDTQIATATIPDATTSVKGKIQLAGDLTGTATSPEIATDAITTPKLANTAVTTAKISDANVTYAKIQNVSASDKVLGRISPNAGVIEEIATTGSGNVVRATSPTLVTPNLGTPSTLVLSNATGLTLTTGVTGILPIANGGTGSSTKNFVDLSTNQTIAGTKIFNSDSYVNQLRIGKGSGNNIQNTAFGYSALNQNTTGEGNTAIGFQGLMSNTTGNSNTAVGFASGIDNTTGGGNTSVGYQALQKNTGNNNIAIGTNTMYLSQNSNSNIAIGNSAIISSNGAGDNIVLGNNTAPLVTNASRNVIIGNGAGNSITTETNNTIVGYNTNISAGVTNATALGNGASVNTSNKIQLGNSAITSVNTSGVVTANGFIKTGGTAAQFLKADGTLDTTTYLSGTVAIANGGTGATTALTARANLGLANVDNTSDLNKPIATATQTALDTKENLTNKSTTTTLGTSNDLYPTQNAVKTYVDTQIASATIVDADATTKGKIQLAGDLGGSAAAPTVPELANKENLVNKSIDVSTDGTSDEKYPSVKAVKDYVDSSISSGTIPDATNTLKGKIQLAGDLTGTAASPTVANGAITTSKLADNAITSAKIVDGTIVTIDLADDAVTSAKIVDGTIVTIDLADDAVTSGKIVDGTIVTTDLADDAVTSAKIVDGTIVTTDLADDAVETSKIKNSNVTTSKLADASVTTAKIVDGTIVNADVSATAAIAFSKLNIIKSDIEGLGIPGSDTTYSAGTGVTLTGTTFSIGQSVATTASPTFAQINKVTITEPTTNATLTLADGKTLTTTDDATVSGTNTGDQTITLTGDLTGTGTGSFATTLANSGVTAGTYGSATEVPSISIDAKGRITSASTTTISGVSPIGSALTDGNIIVGDASNEAASVPVTGDVTITNAGITTIGTGKVTSGKILDGTILVADLANNAVETAKIKDANVTYAKIQNVSATDKVLGRVSSGAGVIEEIATTGSGDVVRATSPTLATPDLGVPSAVDLTNATGLPLTTGVTGILPEANGGTGSATKNFVDLTTDQTIAGVKTFSGTSTVVQQNLTVNSAGTSGQGIILSDDGDIVDNNDGAATFRFGAGIKINDGNGSLGTTTKITLSNTGNITATGTVESIGFKLSGGAPAVGKVLTSDANGIGSWTALPATSLASGVTGTLPVANGGTGSTTQNFVDLTTDQTVAGVKTFSSDIVVNGVKIGRGTGDDGQNTAIGNNALGTGTGTRNTGIGYNALGNYTGASFDNNTAVGYSNSNSITTGQQNTALGAEALMAVTTANSNTAIGAQSLLGATGSGNTALGYAAGQIITSGTNNTFLGNGANAGLATATNATAIGSGATVAGSNTIQLGNASVTSVNTSGAITSASGITGTQLTSTVAIGTAPLVVTSTTPVANLSIGGNAATVTTNANLTGDVTSVGNATTVGKINGTALSGLATGILKNTTTTGVPSIAVAADFPTLNQNTTGTAANVTGTVAIANGGTGATTAVAALANLTGNPSPNTVLAGLASGTTTIVSSDGSALTGWSNTGNLPALDNTITATSFKFGPSNNWDMERDLGQSLMGKSYQFDIYFTANSNNAFLFGHNSSGSNGRGIYLSQVGTSNGFISGTNSFLYTNKDGADTNTFTANTWYTIKVNLASGTNACSYSINGVQKSTFTWTDSGTSWFGFVSDGGISYIDNINVTSVNTGSPSFRALVASDIPTLNQNTTGTAANVTGTVAIANGGTGSTTKNFVDLTTSQTIAGTKTFSTTIAGSITGNAATATTATNIAGGAAGSLPYQTAAATTAMLAKGADGQVLTLVSGSPSWSNAAGSTVVTSSTTYAITLADAYVFYTGTAAGALTIPAAASTNAGKAIIIKNKTAFGITITPATTGNIYIDTANTAVNTVTIGIEASNNWIKLVSDGTQWNVLRALF